MRDHMQASQFEQFRAATTKSFSFFKSLGFCRMPQLEETSPTGATVVYVGKHVGFIFSLDVRDQCIDAQVVKVQNGCLKRNWEGGYSSDIYGHLITHAGYRGNPNPSGGNGPGHATEYPLQGMIDGWANLLRHAGQSLLEDRPDSLPK